MRRRRSNIIYWQTYGTL